MTFTVTYRDKSGKKVQKAFEAESRAELFAQLKERKINALKVDNGNTVTRTSAFSPLSPKTKALIAPILIIAAGAVSLYFFLSKPAVAPVVRTDAPKTRTSASTKTAPTNAAEKVSKADVAAKAVKPEKPLFVKKPGSLQLPNGEVLTFPVPKPGKTRKVYAHGRTYECDHEGNFRDITPRKLFKTSFQLNFLGLAQEGKPYIPAFLTGLDEADVKRMLLKDYEKLGDETPEEMAALKAYDDMRCAALNYMEQGGKFDDFVMEYAAFDKDQRQSRAMCISEVMKLYRDGKIQDAYETAVAANRLMEKKGFKPITLPPRVADEFNAMAAQEPTPKE